MVSFVPPVHCGLKLTLSVTLTAALITVSAADNCKGRCGRGTICKEICHFMDCEHQCFCRDGYRRLRHTSNFVYYCDEICQNSEPRCSQNSSCLLVPGGSYLCSCSTGNRNPSTGECLDEQSTSVPGGDTRLTASSITNTVTATVERANSTPSSSGNTSDRDEQSTSVPGGDTRLTASSITNTVTATVERANSTPSSSGNTSDRGTQNITDPLQPTNLSSVSRVPIHENNLTAVSVTLISEAPAQHTTSLTSTSTETVRTRSKKSPLSTIVLAAGLAGGALLVIIIIAVVVVRKRKRQRDDGNY